MKVTENQNVVVEKEVDVGVVCDECGKEIRNKDNINKRNSQYPYYEVTTHHHDWGNDSIDSFEYLDLCSWECVMTNIKKYYKSANGSESYDIERTY